MKLLIAAAILVLTASMYSCKSSTADTPKSFCDTACLKDTIKFAGDHKLKPSLTISPKDCGPDSIIWTYKGMGTNRKTGFTYLLNTTVNLNKNFIRCYFRDTAMAYLLFNDCVTGRGFQIRLPFDKKQSIGLRNSGINGFDPKFSVSENLLVNTDRGNIFVEDMSTGKKAMMTFGQPIDIDYNVIHDHIDSVNVTNDRIWVKILIDKKWEVKEKKITFE